MKRVGILAIFSGLSIALCIPQYGWSSNSPGQAQTSASQNSQTSSSSRASANLNRPVVNLRSGTKIAAQLESAVDAKTAKPGQKVVARVTKDIKQHGKVIVHKGDRLIGHVTSVNSGASSKNGSTLGVAFNELQNSQGTSQLNAVLTSVFSTRNNARAQAGEMPMGGPVMSPMPAGGGGGLLGGAGSAVGATVDTAGSTVGGLGGTVGSTLGGTVNAAGSTVGQVGGTVGIAGNGAGNVGGLLGTPLSDVHLRHEAQGQASGNAEAKSFLSTKHGDLRLVPGTGMKFRAVGQDSGNATANAGASHGKANANVGANANANVSAQAKSK